MPDCEAEYLFINQVFPGMKNRNASFSLESDLRRETDASVRGFLWYDPDREHVDALHPGDVISIGSIVGIDIAHQHTHWHRHAAQGANIDLRWRESLV